MELRYGASDREPQATPSPIAMACLIEPGEPLEDRVPKRSRHAGTIVVDVQHQGVRCPKQRQLDLDMSVPRRIVDQIADHPFDQPPIAKQRRIEPLPKRDRRPKRPRPLGLRSHDVVETNHPVGDQLTLVEARQHEQVIDQQRQVFLFAQDRAGRRDPAHDVAGCERDLQLCPAGRNGTSELV